MGLETICWCSLDDVSAEAKVLLESAELILRAPFRRTIKLADITKMEAADGSLRLHAGRSALVLALGQDVAAKWAKRIATPPPSLAHKLGIGHASPAFVIGAIEDPALLEVLDGHTAGANTAKVSLAIAHDERDLERVLAFHAAHMGKAPIWIIHGKGPAASFGETPVRQQMRARGYRDTKVSAVSTTLSATRYSPG